MKNSEKSKPTKKRILMYYLILAACLLVIAAITVGVVFGLKGDNLSTDNIIDAEQPDDDDNNDDKPPVVDTSTRDELIAPVKTVSLLQSHAFAYDKTLDRYCVHLGVDFSGEAGTEVLAAVDGTVKSVTTSDKLYGATITLEHANGITTVYKYVDPDESLKAGDTINRGDVIGTIAAATGAENADGAHLHFEVYKNNKIQNPNDFLDLEEK